RPGRVPGGNGRLAGEHRDVGGERSRPALGEVPIALRRVVDHVDRPAPHHVERGLALPVLEHDVPAREHELRADLRQEVDLLRREPRKERRIVGVEEILYRGRRVIARHRSRPTLRRRAATPAAARRSVRGNPGQVITLYLNCATREHELASAYTCSGWSVRTERGR